MAADDKPDYPVRIGLTTYREQARWGVWDESADLLPTSYAREVTEAGGVALLLPPANPVAVGSVLDGLHGLVLAGGADIDPIRYGQQRDRHTGPARSDRDGWELALVTAAIDRGLPVLAICRGLQVLNVACGGDLVQHLPSVVGTDEHCPSIGQHGQHPVRIAEGSALADLLAGRATVATYHHQAIGQLGDGLIASAWAGDGTIEAVERPGGGWLIGVQWHPEVLDGARLFEAFVRAAGRYRAGPSR